MLRPAASLPALALLVTLALAAGAGQARAVSPTSAGSVTAPSADSLEALWRAAKQTVAITPGTTDYQPGRNRVSFLVIDPKGRPVTTPTATVWVATGLKQRPFQQTLARSEPIGVPGGASAGIGSIFVVTVTLPRPGTYWLLAAPLADGVSIRALGNLVVRARPSAPGVGDRAVAARTPTLASTGGKLARLSTATHPDPRLYRISVAAALSRHLPFVVAFATPRFCTSRTCGPVVDVVDAVAKKLARTPVRFIHAEIYRDNDPAKGFAPWVRQWRLDYEPATFVVDRRGIVRAKLVGAFSVGELERTVRSTLLR
ncbi:MAG TPA: hypothetical protein VFB26_04285 [Gaiellaceae bacterium]|nr:hypothetical protein [Gaiellaceae bacterium]